MSTKRGHWASKKPYGQPEYKKARYAMYRTPRIGWPQEKVVDLVYTTAYAMTSVGAANVSTKYVSEAYDVDPTVGGHVMPGFTQYANFYARYRTLAMSYEVEFANKEAFPVVCIAGFSNSTAAVVDLENCGNPLWKTKLVGALTGYNLAKLKDSRTIVEISGTKQALYDDLFTGSTTSATMPTAGTIAVYFAAQTPTGVFTAAGLDVKVRLTLKLQFSRANTIDV